MISAEERSPHSPTVILRTLIDTKTLMIREKTGDRLDVEWGVILLPSSSMTTVRAMVTRRIHRTWGPKIPHILNVHPA